MSVTFDDSIPPPESDLKTSDVPAPASAQPISRESSKKGKGSEKPLLLKPILRNTRTPTAQEDEATWGSNFWVTLVDPQTQTSFFACPATGQVSWDPPVGNFVLPPSTDGEWWELSDDSRGGLPYYYQTRTGETVWERPSGFVIPLGIIQNTALGRRLSRTAFDRFSKIIPNGTPQPPETKATTPNGPNQPRSKNLEQDVTHSSINSATHPRSMQKASPNSINVPTSNRLYVNTGSQLTPIPGSPYTTDHSAPPSPLPHKITAPNVNGDHFPVAKSDNLQDRPRQSQTRPQLASYTSHRPQKPQSLQAVAEILTSSHSDAGHTSSQKFYTGDSSSASSSHYHGMPNTPTKGNRHDPQSPQRPIPPVPQRSASVPMVGGKEISAPIINHSATVALSPVKNRAAGQPIPVQHVRPTMGNMSAETLSTGHYPTLPHALATDIQHFSESDYARQYFSTHRSGFIFKRRVPVEQMMTWQKMPLASPLLMLNRNLHKDAVKVFKVIQHIMGDRERERGMNVRLQADSHVSMVNLNASSTSLAANHILEEERWLLGEGLTHGELRDEIYCQLMKQLTGNLTTESIFKGWQLLCVLLITFPPSKNFESSLFTFVQKHTTHQEGRVDVMAKCCLKRLAAISKRGPRGKPPTIAEIETASDAAFNPSTFGESLDAIIRLQERNYPHQKVPIILPFLSDGILALGGPKSEGIFRVPGDNDSISELKLRIDRGYYTLDGVDDPHVLASLMKLWLRELCDPLVPEEMYNECILNAKDPDACVRIIERLPTINRRVVLFVVSFLQLFLEERTQRVTKMTPANLALVMAPNLLRCSSDSMSVVFTNSQFEQIFVYNLLLHLNCDEIDANYKPSHGLGAIKDTTGHRMTKTRSRRQNQ